MIKTQSITQFQFTIITNEKSYTDSPICISALRLLRELPQDILQLENSINHFDFIFRYGLKKTYDLFSLPEYFFEQEHEIEELFKRYCSLFNNSIVKIFFIDPRVKNHIKIAELIEKVDFAYFNISFSPPQILKYYNQENCFNNSVDLIELIKRDYDLIQEIIVKEYSWKKPEGILINPNKSFIKENPKYNSNILENNYFIFNQLIGNHWLIKSNKIEVNPDERITTIIDQAKKVDSLTYIMYEHAKAKPVNDFYPYYPPLILLSPYHFPKTKKYVKKPSVKEKAFLKVYLSEQRQDYQFEVDDKVKNVLSDKEIAICMAEISNRLCFLDYAGYIHAMFSYSPIIRLPLIGKSINLELSHFDNYLTQKDNSTSVIEKFGKKLNELLIADELQEYLLNRDGQVVTISDLPIEWLYLNDFPFCYTHDICRIPEYNQNGIINDSIQNQRFTYIIPENIIEKTLVIHCASPSDTAMNNMFDFIDSFKERFNFQSVRCASHEEISNAIKEYKPDLLIFDCHGDYDKEALTSYLVIDEDKKVYLTGDDIVKYNISAPLVILSACNTMPNYGYVKYLTDAFMEVGSFSVTATFLPLLIKDAATIIVRILNKLSQQKEYIYHSNWLNFMSHALRTTLIHESIKKAQEKGLIKEIEDERIAQFLTETMVFNLRQKAFFELESLINSNDGNKKVTLKDLNNEWLSYTIIGRADLLYFDNWINKYRDLNGLKTTTPNNV